MPRAKKAPIAEATKEFNLFDEEDVINSPEDTPSEVATPKSNSKVCSAECPHYTSASQECAECWSKLYPQ